MKERKPVYLYKDKEYIGFFSSISEASKYTKECGNVIGDVLEGKRKLTRKGFHYSKTKLTQEEINQLPIKKIINKDKECRTIQFSDSQVTYQAASKKQRIKDFKLFLYKKLYPHWQKLPKPMANLEKAYINEFLDSIS